MGTDELIAEYVRYCESRNLRPTYVYHQRLALQRLDRHLDGSLLDATTETLAGYVESRDLKPGARATEIAYLRGFYTWAHDEGLAATNPARKVVRPRQVQRLPRPMPDHDIVRALAEAPCSVAPILGLAVYAGLRACEIAQLRAEDITTSPAMIRIRESKGGGESAVPVAPALDSILARCPLPVSGWLFPGRDGGHLSRTRICQIANRHLQGLGIGDTLHTLRHAYGTAIYRATRDLRLTQELMRHRSIQSTVGYTKLSPEDSHSVLAGLQW